VFGVNDGLVSNTSLVMGFAGSGTASTAIAFAGLAGLLTGQSPAPTAPRNQEIKKSRNIEAHQWNSATSHRWLWLREPRQPSSPRPLRWRPIRANSPAVPRRVSSTESA
jgi:hypothetical protein